MMLATLTRWMTARSETALATAAGVLLMAGCAAKPPLSRSNAPPQGQPTEINPMQENYAYMADNALLADRSISAVHFVPETAELNTLGVRRLLRYVSILKVYGGKLRYDGTDRDFELRDRRVDQIRSFLLASGLEADQFEVEQGFAASDDMLAMESLLIRGATRGPGDVKITPSAGGVGDK